MSDQRIGLGVDLHRFTTESEPPRPLVLGGVTIRSTSGLAGHSDADALCHALSDAILGACGLGDIGTHFPDSDERYKGADSLVLLGEVVEIVKKDGWHLVNADCTVVTEEPKLAPFRDQMVSVLSKVTGGPVHVKGTRAEGLGSLGRVEGVACFAVALVEH